MPELSTVALIRANPGSADLVRTALTKLAAATQGESGCEGYDLYESTAASGTFVTVERWRRQDDFDAHLRTPHLAAAVAATEGHLAGDPSVDMLGHVTIV